MNSEYPILQYEFFNIKDIETRSLGEVMTEGQERIIDGLPLALMGDDTACRSKTVVRIFDVDGEVLRLVKRIKRLEQKRTAYVHRSRRNPFSERFITWRISQLEWHSTRIKRLIVGYLVEYINNSFRASWSIAKETNSHAFRAARREEYIELRQAALRSEHFWLFVYEPNDLLADTMEDVVRLM